MPPVVEASLSVMAERITDAEARARVAQWCPTFQPTVPFPGALKPWQGVCLECGADVAPQYSNLQQRGGACRACGRKRATSIQRRSDDAAREKVALWAPSFIPATPYPGAALPWPGVCVDCGDSVEPTFHSMQQGRGHCPNCGRLKSQAARRLTDDVARASFWDRADQDKVVFVVRAAFGLVSHWREL